MAIGSFTSIPVDALPDTDAPYARGPVVEDISSYIGTDIDDETVDTLNAIVQDMRLALMSAMVQDAVEDAEEGRMVEEIMSYRFTGESTSWRSFDQLVKPYVEEAEEAYNGAGKLVRALAVDAVDAIAGFVADGVTKQRRLARMVVAIRFTGMSNKSWEDLSQEYGTAEKTMREEMQKFNLPTSHI